MDVLHALSPINLDYKNVLMLESMKIVGKAKADEMKGRK